MPKGGHIKDPLEHPVRKDIVDYIEENPGTHYNEIKRHTGERNGTVSYHLDILENVFGVIVSEKDNLRRRYRVRGAKMPENRVSPVQQNIMDVLGNNGNGGMTQSDVARRTGLSNSTVLYHMNKLGEKELVSFEKRGKRKFYTLNTAPINIDDKKGESLISMS